MKSPINITWKSEAFPILAILGAVAVSFLSYGSLPEKVITHWNLYGQADGWSSRDFHAIFFPALLAGVYLLMLATPFIDPRRERYADFSAVYNIFRGAIIGVLFVVFVLATLANLGYEVNIAKSVSFIIGILMIVMGNYMAKVKNNWFVGIRTPWTLSSEAVWLKTHRLGGYLFVVFGLILIATPYLPPFFAAASFIAGIILVTIVPMAASYIFFRRERRGNHE